MLLSLLELATIEAAGTVADTSRETTAFPQQVEATGCRRLWYAEHHDSPAIHTCPSVVLIAHTATSTSSIRLGSRGVLASHHNPILVANSSVRCRPHPERIDLVIGRGPGTGDEPTVRTLHEQARSQTACRCHTRHCSRRVPRRLRPVERGGLVRASRDSAGTAGRGRSPGRSATGVSPSDTGERAPTSPVFRIPQHTGPAEAFEPGDGDRSATRVLGTAAAAPPAGWPFLAPTVSVRPVCGCSLGICALQVELVTLRGPRRGWAVVRPDRRKPLWGAGSEPGVRLLGLL